MIVGIDPKIDYAFKHLFGREATRPILIDLLEKVLAPAPGHEILDIELLNPFNPKETLDDKLSVLDIKARDQSGRQFNVEMQMLSVPDYEKRILYYACKLHQQPLHEGEDYVELKPTISISFLDHVRFPQVPDFHLCFQLREKSHDFRLTEDLEFHILELPKFKKSLAELTSGLDVWLYFLRNAAMMDMDALPAEMREPLVVRALEELKMLTQTDLERERYESRRKAQMDERNRLRGARLEGREEGRIEGEIRLCQRLLNQPETPTEELAALSIEELTRLAADLEDRVRQRK